MAVAIEAEHAAFAAAAGSQPTQETDAETQGTQRRPPMAASSSATAAAGTAIPKGGAEAEVEAGDATAKPKKGKGKKKKGPGGGAVAAAPQAAKDVLTGCVRTTCCVL
jgi:hypothetical protein